MGSIRYYVVGQIEAAFFALMREKDYADITVTDIVKRAQVSRASFYRHFTSVGDVIDHSLGRIFESITDDIIETLLSNDEKKIRDFLFRYTYKNVEMHETLAACLPSNTAVIFSRLMSRIQQDNNSFLKEDPAAKYRLYARTGVINSVLMKWMYDGKEEPLEEIVNCIMKFILLL